MNGMNFYTDWQPINCRFLSNEQGGQRSQLHYNKSANKARMSVHKLEINIKEEITYFLVFYVF